MMKRETLKDWRRPIGKLSYYPSVEHERQLIDSHLEALDEIDRLTKALDLAGQICPWDCDGCHDEEECPCENCARKRAT